MIIYVSYVTFNKYKNLQSVTMVVSVTKLKIYEFDSLHTKKKKKIKILSYKKKKKKKSINSIVTT